MSFPAIATNQVVIRKLYRDLYHYATKLNHHEQMIQIQGIITTHKYYNNHNATTTTTATTNNNQQQNAENSVGRNIKHMEELLQKQKHFIKQQKNRNIQNLDNDDDGSNQEIMNNSHMMKQILLDELRSNFRQTDGMNDSSDDVIQQRIKLGQSKLSFLQMTTNVKPRKIDDLDPNNRSQRRMWVYRDGEKVEITDHDGMTPQQRKALSSYNGANLDPQAVSHHKKLLRRAGFVNNQHAKGIF